MAQKIYFKGIKFENATYATAGGDANPARLLFSVEFSNGGAWFPKDAELTKIYKAREACKVNNEAV